MTLKAIKTGVSSEKRTVKSEVLTLGRQIFRVVKLELFTLHDTALLKDFLKDIVFVIRNVNAAFIFSGAAVAPLPGSTQSLGTVDRSA